MNKLLAVEIYKSSSIDEVKEKIKKAKEYYYLIDDLSEPYVIRFIIDENNESIEPLEPTEIHPLDQYELKESIETLLKEKHNINSKGFISEQSFTNEINDEAMKAYKEIIKNELEKLKNQRPKDG